MPYGYNGRIIEVDLSDKSSRIKEIDDGLYRKFYAGSGLASWLLYSESDIKADPLGPDNTMIFMTGLLTGTPVPTACKASVCAKSPLTGIWGESTVGGFFGYKLKKTGYDGIIVKGKADRPVYIWLNNGNLEIKEASHVWGKDCYTTADILKSETSGKAEVACIGQAGENLVKIAGIMIGGNETRAAGRVGLGAVMGSKNLKAIVVDGNAPINVSDLDLMRKLTKELTPLVKQNTKGLTDFGTAGSMQAVELNGDLPIKNWREGSFEEGAMKTSGQMIAKTMLTGHYACYGCPIRCGKTVEIKTGPHAGTKAHGPEYETCAGFGALILNEDVYKIAEANDLCNRYGLDTISTSGTIAFAYEAYEKGIITKEDTGGLDLRWGDGEAACRLIPMIANRQGIGDILAEGSREAAKILGKNSVEFTVEVKGLEMAYHDPRAFTSMAGNYATANKGACHLEALSYFAENGAYSPNIVGFDKPFEPHGYINKGEMAAVMQDYQEVFNPLGLCKFLNRSKGLDINNLAQYIKSVTGWEIDGREVLKTGERIHNIKRQYNVRLGISRKDDMLPYRLLTHKRGSGGAEDSLPHLGWILNEYYRTRGWSEEGIPTEEKIKELDLE